MLTANIVELGVASLQPLGYEMKAKVAGLLAGVLLTPLALLLAASSAGAGHGDYVVARALFPFSILSTHLTGSLTIVGVALACAQYPLYGYLIGAALQKKRPWSPGVVVATGAHTLAVALVFAYPNGFAS